MNRLEALLGEWLEVDPASLYVVVVVAVASTLAMGVAFVGQFV